MNESPSIRSNLNAYEVAILILTLIVLAALVVDTIAKLPADVSQVLHWMDTTACGIFFIDFVVRFYKAKSKLAFMKWGWIDLIACIPNISLFRWGRLARILRIIRLLRAIRSVQRICQVLFSRSTETGFVSIGLTASLLVIFSSVSILICETSPESNIKNAEDAVWWSISTLTTVGYGDKYPVTSEGRILGMVLMTAGVGLFGGLSGLVASMFLGTRDARTKEQRELIDRLEKLQNTVDKLQMHLNTNEQLPPKKSV